MHIPHACVECEGKGSTVQKKQITVPVPAGKIQATPDPGQVKL